MKWRLVAKSDSFAYLTQLTCSRTAVMFILFVTTLMPKLRQITSRR
jgi:hypothetical protein